MKIQNINSKNLTNYKSVINIKKKTTENNRVANNTREEKIINPKYYQVANNINFTSKIYYLATLTQKKAGSSECLTLRIPLKDSDSITLEFSEKETALFFKKNEKLDKETLDFFVDYYMKHHKEKQAKYERDKAYLISVLNGEIPNNTIAFNPIQNKIEAFKKAADAEPDEYLQTLINNIADDNERCELASKLLEKCEEKYAKSTYTCAKEIIYLIALSKKGDKLDLSDIDIKTEIAIYVTELEEITSQNCYDLIIEASKDSKGDFDLILCLYLSKILINLFDETDIEAQIKNISSILKEISQKDQKHKNEAMNEFTTLIEKGVLNPNNKREANCFMICFNPKNNNFELEAAELLDELLELLDKWCAQIYNFTDIKAISSKVINDYFNEIRNPQTGNLSTNHISPSEFLENYQIL